MLNLRMIELAKEARDQMEAPPIEPTWMGLHQILHASLHLMQSIDRDEDASIDKAYIVAIGLDLGLDYWTVQASTLDAIERDQLIAESLTEDDCERVPPSLDGLGTVIQSGLVRLMRLVHKATEAEQREVGRQIWCSALTNLHWVRMWIKLVERDCLEQAVATSTIH